MQAATFAWAKRLPFDSACLCLDSDSDSDSNDCVGCQTTHTTGLEFALKRMHAVNFRQSRRDIETSMLNDAGYCDQKWPQPTRSSIEISPRARPSHQTGSIGNIFAYSIRRVGQRTRGGLILVCVAADFRSRAGYFRPILADKRTTKLAASEQLRWLASECLIFATTCELAAKLVGLGLCLCFRPAIALCLPLPLPLGLRLRLLLRLRLRLHLKPAVYASPSLSNGSVIFGGSGENLIGP